MRAKMTQNTKTARPDSGSAWAAARERLRRELGDAVFDAWIGPLTLVSSDGDEITVGAVKPFVRNWVANHYVARIERAFRAEGIEQASVSVVLVPEKPQVAGGVMRTVSLPQPSASVSILHPQSEPPREEEARGL